MKNMLVLLVFIVVLLSVPDSCRANLRKNFYRNSCPGVETLVRDLTQRHVSSDAGLPADLIRMHFHDCFVKGCDASVLINSTSGNSAERDAIPNQTLEGFEVIEDIKAQVEKKCPGVVSCADILTLAARDSVSFQFKKDMWEVLTGRRDGRISKQSEASSNIPSPFMNFTQLLSSFKSKGLTEHDLVVLSGAHTIGLSHCAAVRRRLYNFTGVGDQDPALDATYATLLKSKCPNTNERTITVEMDPNSSLNFDTNYYTILKQNKGLFMSDAALLTDKTSSNIVTELTDKKKFFTEFAQSMKRMAAIEVLTGTAGEIRKKCGVIN